MMSPCTTCLRSVLAAMVCHHAQSLLLQVHLGAMHVWLRAGQHQQEPPLARAAPRCLPGQVFLMHAGICRDHACK